MKVEFLPEVVVFFENLAIVLQEKGYFGSFEFSRKYTDELTDDIIKNLPFRQHKPAPKYFDKYGKGMKYASFKKNRNTTWYAFFKTYIKNGEAVYLVRYIGNNHTDAHHL